MNINNIEYIYLPKQYSIYKFSANSNFELVLLYSIDFSGINLNVICKWN